MFKKLKMMVTIMCLMTLLEMEVYAGNLGIADNINLQYNADSIVPYYLEYKNADIIISRIGNVLQIDGIVSSYGNNDIYIYVKLEQYKEGKWVSITAWSDSASSADFLRFQKTRPIAKGYKYRAIAIVTCGTEQVTRYSNELYY